MNNLRILTSFLSFLLFVISPLCVLADAEGYFEKGQSAKDNKNYQKAAKWFRKAANKGHGPSMHQLAYLLEDDGNHEEAFKWFRKACKYGEDFACYRVGTAYKYGSGVIKDGEEAVKIFR